MQQDAVPEINNLNYSQLYVENFSSISIDELKPSLILPHFRDKPQTIYKIIDEGQNCIYIETDGRKYERHGILIAENVLVEDDMTIEIKVKPDGGSEGVVEFWLIGDDSDKWINFKLFGGYYGKKLETVVSFNGDTVYLPRKLWSWKNWYHLHIRLQKEKTIMALLDENRRILSRHCFLHSASSLFDSFSVAISQEMGMNNVWGNQMMALIADLKVGRCLNNVQDIMSMPTNNDLVIIEIAEALKNNHHEKVVEIYEKYRDYEPKIRFYLEPLLYELQAKEYNNTFVFYKIIVEFDKYTAHELVSALSHFANYNILKSKFYIEHSKDMDETIYNVYTAIKESNLFSKSFGKGALLPYYIFKNALFENKLNNQFWLKNDWQTDYFNAAFHKKTKIGIIGDILKAVDSSMRIAYGYPQPVEKPKLFKAYDNAIAIEIAKTMRRAQKRAQDSVEIDMKKIGGIRILADDIQERLITDDLNYESPLEPEVPSNSRVIGIAGHGNVYRLILACILQNDMDKANKIINEHGLILSVVIDEINEMLFDQFNDNCIEFIDNKPVVVEDYIYDLKGIINI